MKSKVQDVVNASLKTFKYWVNTAIDAAIGAIDWTITNVSQFITNVQKTYNDFITNTFNTINQIITNVQNTYNNFITNVSNTFNEYITNVTEVYNRYVTNKTYQTIQYVTNVIGVLDPLGFLKDPRGYITGVWNLLIDPWAHGIVKSFYEGLEEGLEE